MTRTASIDIQNDASRPLQSGPGVTPHSGHAGDTIASAPASPQSRGGRVEGLAELQIVAVVADLMNQVAVCRELEDACRKLVVGMQNLTGCSDVALGLAPPAQGGVSVQAIATLATFDASAERILAIKSALNESLVRNEISAWPPLNDGTRCGLKAHARLLELTQSAGVVSGPLKDSGGTVQGAWLFLLKQPPQADRRAFQIARLTGMHTATAIGLIRRAEGGRLARISRGVSRVCRSNRRKLWGIGLACVLLAGLIPMSETIRCRCEVQPVSRRFVASPFEASLDRSFVRSGDVVAEGDTLARLDGRELKIKLAALQAEIQQAAKKHDAELADRRLAEARLTQLEISEAELERDLHLHRLGQLEIRSPVDGVVISGDLDRAEGVRLSLGQMLFEIAPLDRMIVELEISQADISHVVRGMPVEIDLEADDGRRRSGVVTRIHPQSVRKDQQYVFPAEIILDNSDGTLRPGMRGRARLTGDSRTLGSLLFRRPWHQLMFMIGW